MAAPYLQSEAAHQDEGIGGGGGLPELERWESVQDEPPCQFAPKDYGLIQL